MAKKPKKFSPFSFFEGHAGISEEWKKIWSKINDEARKTIKDNLNNLGTSQFTEMGKDFSNPELKDIWTKFNDETQKAIKRTLKKFEAPQFTEMGKAFTNPELKDVWTKFNDETQKAVKHTLKKFEAAHFTKMGKTLSNPELKDVWTKFNDETQKAVKRTLKNFETPQFTKMSQAFSNPELKDVWTKFNDKTKKAITHNLKNFGASSYAEVGKALSNAEWKDIWIKVSSETQKSIKQNLKNFGVPEAPEVGNTIFDSEVMAQTFAQAIEKLSKKPEKTTELHARYLNEFQNLLQSTIDQLQGKVTTAFGEPATKDKRFQEPEWNDNPFFSLLRQAYFLNAKFLKELVSSIDGLDPITSRKLMFYTNHLIDALSPTNFPLTNPTVLHETLSSSGKNLVRGFQKYLEDSANGQWSSHTTDMKAFKPGKNLATTPGKVVFQNDLFQLIQYDPLTKRVAKRPLLIIPPWINKYYIFDLKPENSFVRWALESGLTVFIVSWVNPDKKHAHKTMTDYTLEGVKTAVDQVCQITEEKKINTIGYCSGGILLSFLMCYLKDKKSNPIASATFIATPFDFSKADELGIYRCEHQQRKLEEHVQKKGYLEGQYMVRAFNLLRANDLIWPSYVNNYLLGREPFPFDMLYWNSDALRMPAKMHMDYLQEVVIENRLMKPGSIHIGNVPIDLEKISVPLFVMAAQSDHIAPWRSVYPITQMAKSPSKRFVLSTSGHVAGAINHPSKKKYHYWTSDKLPQDADSWLNDAQKHDGSWWEEWRQWLDIHGDGTVPARPISKDRIIEAAPGKYALTVGE